MLIVTAQRIQQHLSIVRTLFVYKRKTSTQHCQFTAQWSYFRTVHLHNTTGSCEPVGRMDAANACTKTKLV